MKHIDGCTDCSGYSAEFDSLLSLLKAQPRVEVPSDFDFKLRARIARAESERIEATSSPIEWLSRLWAGSFSRVQTSAAMAAMAAVALVISVSTYQINQRVLSPVNTIDNGRQAGAVRVSEVQVASADAGNRSVGTVSKSSLSNASTESAGVANTIAKLSAPRSRAAARSENLAGDIDTASSQTENNANGWRVFNHEQGRMVTTPSQLTLIGAEGVTQSAGRVAGYVPSI